VWTTTSWWRATGTRPIDVGTPGRATEVPDSDSWRYASLTASALRRLCVGRGQVCVVARQVSRIHTVWSHRPTLPARGVLVVLDSEDCRCGPMEVAMAFREVRAYEVKGSAAPMAPRRRDEVDQPAGGLGPKDRPPSHRSRHRAALTVTQAKATWTNRSRPSCASLPGPTAGHWDSRAPLVGRRGRSRRNRWP
jgi:hypothetical protein